MTPPPSVAERLDRALDAIAAARPSDSGVARASVGSPIAPLVALAAEVRDALPPPPVAARFEARLGARLAAMAAPRPPLGWAFRSPGRRIVTGAVGSAAVGVGITAFAVWRHGRRTSSPAHR
jgi:anti-sigma-K factor RskA